MLFGGFHARHLNLHEIGTEEVALVHHQCRGCCYQKSFRLHVHHQVCVDAHCSAHRGRSCQCVPAFHTTHLFGCMQGALSTCCER